MYYFFAIWFLNCFAFSCFARVLIFSRYKFCFCFEVKQLRSSSLWLEDSTFEKMSVRNVGSLIIFRRRVLAPGCPFVAESLPLCHAVARGGGVEREPHEPLPGVSEASRGRACTSGLQVTFLPFILFPLCSSGPSRIPAAHPWTCSQQLQPAPPTSSPGPVESPAASPGAGPVLPRR